MACGGCVSGRCFRACRGQYEVGKSGGYEVGQSSGYEVGLNYGGSR